MPDDSRERSAARGDALAYDRYLAGMDASMRQKVALTAAHLLCQGRVADMGMGSGTGSHSLAALYPALEVIGVDLDPEMVRRARERFRLPNLTFVAGDIASPVFPARTLDGIFNSSVLHHVTSFGGYRHDNARDCLAVQVEALRPHGVLIVRDFVDPGGGDVLLDLPADDGDDSGDPASASTASLLERFATEFRRDSDAPGFAYRRIAPDPKPGWRRYRMAHKHAAEFVLRKDYRNDWASEVREEYTYYTQADFERAFAQLGLRILASTPLRNPWIVTNRFEGRISLAAADGEALEFPATNYVIVGERVPAGEGVDIAEGDAAPPCDFLRMSYYRHEESGQVRDLVRRPHLTLDVVPHFRSPETGEHFVLARMSYPRPILRSRALARGGLDGSRAPGYVTEPLNVLQVDEPIGRTVEEALAQRAGIKPCEIEAFRTGAHYYPSPGGTQEEVRSLLVRVAPTYVQTRIPYRSGFSTAGRIAAIEARQLLRAAQVGALPDARLELNVYELLLQERLPPGPWIGAEVELDAATPPTATDVDDLLRRPSRRRFEEVSKDLSAGFLSFACSWFEECDAGGRILHRRPLEYVFPRLRGLVTVSTAPLLLGGGTVWIGVDDDDLPAAQCFVGNSELLVAPAWRLPREVTTRSKARAWIGGRLEAEYGVSPGRMYELGGRYYPSAGVSPEVVHVLAVEVRDVRAAPRALHWIPLHALLAARGAIQDGHLRIASLRAAHALGLLAAEGR